MDSRKVYTLKKIDSLSNLNLKTFPFLDPTCCFRLIEQKE
jgi:hypothetical protein